MTDPNDYINGNTTTVGEVSQKIGGLTKREYFSGLAMQGMLSNSDGINRIWKDVREKTEDKNLAATMAVDHISEMSVELADRLIKQLNEKVAQ